MTDIFVNFVLLGILISLCDSFGKLLPVLKFERRFLEFCFRQVVGIALLLPALYIIQITFGVTGASAFVIVSGSCLIAINLRYKSSSIGYFVKSKSSFTIFHYISVSLLFVLFFTMAVLPPTQWDEFAYGAYLPKLYADAGHIGFLPSQGISSILSQYYHMITIIGLDLTGTITMGRLFSSWIYILFCSSVCFLLIGHRSKSFDLLAVSLVSISAIPVQFISNIKPDMLVALFQIIILFLILQFNNTDRMKSSFLLGFFGGVAFCTKYSSLFGLVILAPIVAYTLLKSDRPVQFFLLACVGLVVACSPLFLGNYLQYGNPVMPLFWQYIGGGEQHSYSSLHHNIYYEMNWEMARYSFNARHSYLEFFPIMSPLFTQALIPLALVFAINIRSNIKNQMFLVLFILTLTVTVYFFFLWNPRFVLLCTPIVVAILLNAEKNRLILETLISRCLKQLPLIITITLGCSVAWVHKSPIVNFLKYPSKTAFIEHAVPFGKVANFLNQNCDGAVALNIQPLFYLNCDTYLIHPMTPMFSSGTQLTADAFLKILHRNDIKFVAFYDKIPDIEKNVYIQNGGVLTQLFSNGFNKTIAELQMQKEVDVVKRWDDLTIYKISSVNK